MTIFDWYRRLLTIAVCTYVIVRTISFVWRWQASGKLAGRTESALRRYMLVNVLRTRLRRFWFDFLQIGGLLAVLLYLVRLHR